MQDAWQQGPGAIRRANLKVCAGVVDGDFVPLFATGVHVARDSLTAARRFTRSISVHLALDYQVGELD